ncbi:hypothetical protein DB30_02716 [Enhygromyxa salina]|uniref:NHL repeat protein n=1 Tax=Enhygromyxa salina TaxID=215803 RepID=A0A0C2DDB7_9BACT|nr:hypothetical protein [Enhygromyxa salina]KIG19435.1 hypothetical protein DB30_02716 [Enhygromyxa salina]
MVTPRAVSLTIGFGWFAIACSSPAPREDSGTNGFTSASSGATTTEDSTSAGTTVSETSTETEDSADSHIKFDHIDSDHPSGGCDPDQIPDTNGFTFVKTIELGIDTLQAGFYDSTRDRVVVFSYFGEGRVLDIQGNILEQVQAPPEALPKLDGGAYDLASDLALLINQDCDLVEVDPETFATHAVIPLGMAHNMSICAGLAIDPMSNLYIASHGTDELVVLDRSGQVEQFRVDMLGIGMPGFDGIAEIAGSENFLINSTTNLTAAIIAADGSLIAGPGLVGDAPIMGGGAVGQPDSMLTICTNGHTWVCDAYETSCSDFAPDDGDKMACGCLVVG